MAVAKLSFHHIRKNISHPQAFFKYNKIYKRWLCVASNTAQETKPESLEEFVKSRFFYNEVFYQKSREKKPNPLQGPIFLKYLEEKVEKPCVSEPEPKVQDDNIHFPFEVNKSFIKDPSTETSEESLSDLTPSDNIQLKDSSKAILNYEMSKRSENNDDIINDNIDDIIKFGTSDPKCPVSSVPCGGCGAMLHCCSPSIPGFLPQEVFKGKNDKELRSEICKRCHFLKEFNIALGINVSPSEYTEIISHVANERALALVLVDMTDFPCSINPKIFELLGTKAFFVVGNKVDLIIQEGFQTVDQLKMSLTNCLEIQGVNMKNILHIGLISAKTGYGIEELINKLHKFWRFKGDIYLIGCTNSGKSTLFNTLINSDLCKVQAMKIMHKATVSHWPGTTLNLLKFPIISPSMFRLTKRVERLKEKKFSENEMIRHRLLKTIDFTKEQIPLYADIERTDFSKKEDDYIMPNLSLYEADLTLDEKKLSGIDPSKHPFDQSKWCHDTPGVVFDDQIINLLTTPELLLTIPKKMLIPRNFHLYPGSSLFIGGLARLDFIKGPKMAWFTVYASSELPITVTETKDAPRVYKELLGSEYFRVPFGGEARLKKWPALSSKKLQVCSKSSKEAAADIVLSNAGWISVTAESAYQCVLEAWTPEGRGIHVREIPVIKFGHTFKGPKIQKTPTFVTEMNEISPSKLLKYLENVKLCMSRSKKR